MNIFDILMFNHGFNINGKRRIHARAFSSLGKYCYFPHKLNLVIFRNICVNIKYNF